MTICTGPWCGGFSEQQEAITDPTLLSFIPATSTFMCAVCATNMAQALNARLTAERSAGQDSGRTLERAGNIFIQIRRLLRAAPGSIRRSLNAALPPQGATPATMTGLTMPVVGGRRYRLEAAIVYRTSGVLVGMQTGMAAPNGVSEFSYDVEQNTGSALAAFHASALNTLVGAVNVGPGAVDAACNIGATFLATADGVVALRYQATGLSAPTVTIQAGSTAELFDLTD